MPSITRKGPVQSVLPSAPGTYALVMQVVEPAQIGIGRWGRLEASPGFYVYVGSAFGPGGLAARVGRHCRDAKRLHWHIDYLRGHAELTAVWFSDAPQRLEHRWAATLDAMRGYRPVAGFGCSDCSCVSHLFFSARRPGLAAFVQAAGGAVAATGCGPQA